MFRVERVAGCCAQSVALKVLRPALRSAWFPQRFAAERPTLERRFARAAAAVQLAHARLLLHRDIEPSSILVAAAGDARLLDFTLLTGHRP